MMDVIGFAAVLPPSFTAPGTCVQMEGFIRSEVNVAGPLVCRHHPFDQCFHIGGGFGMRGAEIPDLIRQFAKPSPPVMTQNVMQVTKRLL